MSSCLKENLAFICVKAEVQSRLLGAANGGSANGRASYSALDLGQNGTLTGDARIHSADVMRWLANWRSKARASRIGGAKAAGPGPRAKPRRTAAVKVPPAKPDTALPVWTAGGISTIRSTDPAVAFDAQPIHGKVGVGHKVGSTTFGVVGGFEQGEAHIVPGNTDLRSDTGSVAGYFGRRHGDLLIDGSLGFAHVDNSVRNAAAAGEFGADRVFGTFNLTGVHETPWSRSLPRVGVQWQHESQASYIDSDGDLQAGTDFAPGRVVFGDEVYLVPPDAPHIQPFVRAEGEWKLEFSDTGSFADGTAFEEDDFGMVLGGGLKADFGPGSNVLLEATTDAVGSAPADSFSLKAQASIAY